MPYTDEPPGLRWINNISMTSFGPLVSQVLWAFGSVGFTITACILMLTPDGPSTIATTGIPTSHEAHRQLGFLLAGALLTAWTGKTVAGVVDAQQKRKADPRYATVLEAGERGKASGAAAALVLAQQAQDIKTGNGAATIVTSERPAMRRSTTQQIITEDPIPEGEVVTP